MRRAAGPLLVVLLGLVGSLAAGLALYRGAASALDRVLEERLRGAGEAAAVLLPAQAPSKEVLAALMNANQLDGAYLLDPNLQVRVDATGAPGVRADLLRVDPSRVARAFAGEASVAYGYSVGELRVASGYFPVRDGAGNIREVLALEAGTAFLSARAELDRALRWALGVALLGTGALALVAARGYRTEQREREAYARASRGEALVRMAAMAAHEIRNPLGIIRGTVELMRERAGGNLEARDRLGLEDVLGEVERLRRLTEDFLDLASDRPLAAETVPLAENLGAWAHRFQSLHPDVEVRFEPPAAEVHVRGDPARLRQVLENLLANSVQAGAHRIQLQLSSEAGWVRISVRDDGSGVPPELRAQLFEPFVTHRPGGSGLGLAISQRLVVRHGGTLTLADGAAGHTHFQLQLPGLPHQDGVP